MAEVDLAFRPSGSGGRRINGVNRHESGRVCRVAHHAHNGPVSRVGGSMHKRGLQCVDWNRDVKRRENGHIICAGCGNIQIQGTSALIMGGTTVRQCRAVGISAVFEPTRRICGGRAGTIIVEILRER